MNLRKCIKEKGMPNSKEENLFIEATLYNEKGDSILKDSPYNLTWHLNIPGDEKYHSFTKQIRNVLDKTSKDSVMVIDRVDILHEKSGAIINIIATDGNTLSNIAKEITTNVENLHVNNKPFSLRSLKIDIKDKEMEMQRTI